MISSREFQNLSEKELLRDRSGRGLVPYFAQLSPSQQCSYSAVLSFFEFERVLTNEVVFKAPESDRMGAARLLLMVVYLDTCEPRWSSFMLEKIARYVDNVPGGHVEDLIKATYEMLGEKECLLTVFVGNFIREMAITFLAGYRNSHRFDLMWMTAPSPRTQAQIYFRYWVFGLKPELFNDEFIRETKEALKGTPAAKVLDLIEKG